MARKQGFIRCGFQNENSLKPRFSFHYEIPDVEKAHLKSTHLEGLDYACWAMSTFSSHDDFDAHHLSSGEVCDYGEMKAEMLSGLALSTNANWSDIPDLDLSWLDFGDMFQGIFDGIGAVIGGVFDGV